jgi:hypothetical protein
MCLKSIVLTGSAFLAAPTIASAQDAGSAARSNRPIEPPAPSTPQDEAGDSPATSDAITVTVGGDRPGAAMGAIPPENILTWADLRATGATDINALIEAISPQIGSARGRGGDPAILLLNGQRISSFRELRDIPTDAISRLEILPKQVALIYGYRADQRVINLVLKQGFRSTAALLAGTAATEGGYAGGTADVTRVMIDEGARTSINLRTEGNSMLTGYERDILVGQPAEGMRDAAQAAYSLIGSKRDVRGTFTHYRRIGAVGVTGNAELEHSEGRSLIGLGETLLRPLARDTARDSLHTGLILNGTARKWHWTVTGNADASREVADTDRDAIEARNRAVTSMVSGEVDAIANGAMFRLPAGEASATFGLGVRTRHLDSDRRSDGAWTFNSLGRTSGDASINIDLPISRRGSGFTSFGNLVLSGNARVERLSDLGTLTTIGAGLYWSPVPRLDLTASWTREEGAPTIEQLGAPVLETPGTPLLDFTSGETVLVTAITGGNPRLAPDHRKLVTLGANWKPFANSDLRLRADYVRSRLADPASSLPGPTPTLERAFPERFVRNAAGALISADLRPANFASARRDTLRLGFDIPIRLKSTSRSKGAAQREGALAEATLAESTLAMEPIAPGNGAQPVRTLFSPDDGNRLWFSLTDTITFVDETTVRDGMKLDYLHGAAVGQAGGRPRHTIESRAAYSSNGYGAFLSANWRSGTSVTTATGRDAHFSPFATFDLRLFVNLDQHPGLVSRHPWLEGVSIHLEATNLFNARPNLRDAFGAVPPGFRRTLLDPLGRMVSITLRIGGGGIGG